MSELLLVFIYSLGTALATGLGAIPFFFTKTLSKKWLGICTALAAGCMTGASVLLIYNGYHFSPLRLVSGIASGLIFIYFAHEFIEKYPHLSAKELPKADLTKMLLIVGIMTIHSFAEGVGIGVAFGNSQGFGILIAVAMAIHNIPEGLAISLVLCPRGVSPWHAVGWSIFSSLPQLVAVFAFLFVEQFHPFLPVGLGFAAGAMIWLVWKELVPEALADAGKKLAWGVMGVSALAMFFFEAFL